MADFDPRPKFTWADIAVLTVVGFVLVLGLIDLVAQLVRWLA
jgi:hypothetical protein